MNHPDLDHWLTKATQNVPTEIADVIHDEITAHYYDALEEHLAQGKSEDDAHLAVMIELGDVDIVARGFKQTHSIDQNYRLTMFIGLLYPFAYLLFMPINEYLVGERAVFNLAIFLPIIYILHSFRTYFTDQPGAPSIESNVWLIRLGIITVCLTRFLGWTIYSHPTVLESYSRSLWDSGSSVEMLLGAVSISGMFMIAAGFFLLGEHILRLHDHLYGLLKPLAALILTVAVSFAVYGLGSMVGEFGICQFSEMVGVMSGASATLLWAFIFYRARYQLVRVG